jgi:hypothetical protein
MTEENMFCPSCGLEYTQKTNYCKRCGADLNPSGATVAPKKPQLGVITMFWGVIAFCLTAVTLLLTAWDHFQRTGGCNGMCGDERLLLSFVAFFLFVVTLLLIWQLARMVTAFRRTAENVTVEKHFIREVPTIQPVAPTGQMPEASEVIYSPSVVEHTTRQMAGVYGEPKATK